MGRHNQAGRTADHHVLVIFIHVCQSLAIRQRRQSATCAVLRCVAPTPFSDFVQSCRDHWDRQQCFAAARVDCYLLQCLGKITLHLTLDCLKVGLFLSRMMIDEQIVDKDSYEDVDVQ